ncbi:MAG: S8 family serine peptidase [Jatrophihabitans sp.]
MAHPQRQARLLAPAQQSALKASVLEQWRAHEAAAAVRPVLPHLDPALNAVAGLPGASAADVPLAKDGTVEVSVQGPSATAAVAAVGGRVLARAGGSITVSLKPAKLPALAGHAGVSSVLRAERAVPQVTSEGVQSSGAQTWADDNVGNGGTGVKIGIVDAGFGNLQAEITAGNLDQATVVYPSGQNHCADDTATDHGTGVAEIAHQMAPQAVLYLYCIDDRNGFSQAAGQLVASRVKIVNSSLGFTAQYRGDGSAGAGSTELAVRTAREAGVLWIQSAGNSAPDHWAGGLVDANHDNYVDINGSAGPNDEGDAVQLDPQSSGSVVLSWDQWPTSNLAVTLAVQELDQYGVKVGDPTFVDHLDGDDPTLEIDLDNNATAAGAYHQYDIFVLVGPGTPALRFDLFYGGDVYPSFLSGINAAKAAAGSVLEPATSPWVLSVGAADWQNNTLEKFSSRGPTIDGRVKPDLLGFDGVSSNLSDLVASNGTHSGFFGTSAAAPHVAGAAALVLAANPAMDASDIEAFLERRASPLVNPATNDAGHGLLQLGDPADPSGIQGVAGSGYVALTSPVRLVDTRSGIGGRTGAMVAGTVLPVTLPSSGPSAVPADATAVVVNVTGINAKGTTYLSVFADSYSGSDNLSLSTTDPNAAIAAVVRVNSAHGFKLMNRAANTDAVVDVVGYFASPSSTGVSGYAPISPTRLLDTRSSIGGHQRKMAPNEIINVPVAGQSPVPTGATAAVVTLTALNETAPGYLQTFTTTAPTTSSLDYRKFSRSNLAVVALGPDGSFNLQDRTSSTDAIVDVVGYLSASAPGKFVVLPSPLGIVDTQSGKGGRKAALSANASLTEEGAGLYGIPYHASALWANFDAVATGTGYLQVYAADGTVPPTSNLDYSAGRTVANAVVANLSQPSNGAGQFTTVNRSGVTNLYQDVFGYFVNDPAPN